MRIVVVSALVAAAALGGCSKPTELASNANGVGKEAVPAAPPLVPVDAATPAPGAPPGDLQSAFPDYKPKTTADTVLDYRGAVSGDISALPSVGDAAGLAAAFASWKAKAAAAPGAYEQGAVQLGADPQEYRPSDAELVAAEAGDRLAAALQGADEATKAAVTAALSNGAEARVYRRFDYRHVDVMGSGRYFYASSPKEAALPN